VSHPHHVFPRVLVVEDDPSVAITLKLVLKRGGYAAELVGSASEALGVFAPGKFVLVLTDYEMPGMKGDELAAEIKLRSPGQPVVILTGYLEKLERDGHPAKCDLVLSKPFGADELIEALGRLLSHRPKPRPAPGPDPAPAAPI
jgi:CheY-like chemotaxis protein